MPADSGKPSRHRQQVIDAGFVLDVRSLGRAPGSMKERHRVFTTDKRLGLDLVAIPVGAEIEMDLTLQSVSEGVLVMGTVHAPVEGECSRCLESFTDELELHLTELFAYPDSATEQTTEEDEIHRLVDDMIDLEPVVVDAVGLELPLQPLCEPDCAGLCPECGVKMAIAGSGHGHEILDPRWARLATFTTAESTDADTASDPSTDSTLAGHNGAASKTEES
ncbi:YceD family protein [Nocardia sp. NPDC059240]|uniref:YceD family protein n=1 Tax=Nocardia sp. NPDC059240 TaxID=3346786 RepID=UPI00369883D5